MTIYRMNVTNTEMTSERMEYLVQAENMGAAEITALKQMAEDLGPEDSKLGENYVYQAAVLGELLK